jgi:hypothetical protein
LIRPDLTSILERLSDGDAPMQARRTRYRNGLRAAVVAIVVSLIATVLSAGTRPLAAQTDVIRGRVTNIEGLPLAGVRVTATSIPGNVTRETRTSDKGIYQIAFSGGPGDYIMGFAMIGYVFRQFEIKRLADEEVLVADARLSVIQLDTIAIVSQQQQRVGRNSQTPDVSGTERQVTPNDWPLEELGGEMSMLPNTEPLSLSRSDRNRCSTDGTPLFSRMSMNRVTESIAMPAVCSPSASVPSSD